eukprot:55672-Eustigmatos_ZCMA.PRE.1
MDHYHGQVIRGNVASPATLARTRLKEHLNDLCKSEHDSPRLQAAFDKLMGGQEPRFSDQP